MTRFLRILILGTVLAALLAAPAAAYKVAKTPAPPEGVVGTPYSFTFVTEGGTAPHTLARQSGSLPPGLSLASDGKLSGTPTTAGSFSFYVEAVDAVGSRTQVKFTINVGSKLTVTTDSLPDGSVGTAYAVGLSATGATVSSWSVSGGSLPAGLTLSAGGVISGTPTLVGTSTFTVLASGSGKSDTKTLTLTVTRPLSVAAAAFPPAIVGKPFTAQLSTGGGSGSNSFSVSGGALPRGLALDPFDGVISGTPALAGTFPVEIAVTSSRGSVARSSIKLIVRNQVGFVTTSLPRAKVGKRYSARIVFRGGVAPLTLSSTSTFPAGVSLNAETGVLSGTPRRSGTYRVTIVASDSYGGSALRRFTIAVAR